MQNNEGKTRWSFQNLGAEPEDGIRRRDRRVHGVKAWNRSTVYK
jgi:hypothetical protein